MWQRKCTKNYLRKSLPVISLFGSGFILIYFVKIKLFVKRDTDKVLNPIQIKPIINNVVMHVHMLINYKFNSNL